MNTGESKISETSLLAITHAFNFAKLVNRTCFIIDDKYRYLEPESRSVEIVLNSFYHDSAQESYVHASLLSNWLSVALDFFCIKYDQEFLCSQLLGRLAHSRPKPRLWDEVTLNVADVVLDDVESFIGSCWVSLNLNESSKTFSSLTEFKNCLDVDVSNPMCYRVFWVKLNELLPELICFSMRSK